MSAITPFVHRKVVSLRSDDSARQAAHAMCVRNIGCVIVLDHQEDMAGILTDRDLACAVLGQGKAPDTPISEIMTSNPSYVDENATVEDVIQCMESSGIRRIPVVSTDQEGRRKCIGIVTLDDLAASELIPTDRLSAIVKAQIRRRGSPVSIQKMKAAQGGPSMTSQPATEPEKNQKQLLHFYTVIRERTLLNQKELAPVTHFILSSLVRRLHYTGAAELIATLPERIQEELLDLPAGPDLSITPGTLLEILTTDFQMDEAKARFTIVEFFGALRSLLSEQQLDHIRAQLPEEFRAFLIELPREKAGSAA